MKKRDDRKVKTGQVCIASSSRVYVFNCDLLRSGNTAKECGSEPIQITGAKVRRFLLDVQQFAGQFCLSDEQQVPEPHRESGQIPLMLLHSKSFLQSKSATAGNC